MPDQDGAMTMDEINVVWDANKRRIKELETEVARLDRVLGEMVQAASHDAKRIAELKEKNIVTGEAIDHWHDVAEGWKARAEAAEAYLAKWGIEEELLADRVTAPGEMPPCWQLGGDDYRRRMEKELADAQGKVKALEDALRRDRAYVSAGWELFP